MSKNISDELVILRARNSMTQQQLADKLGTSQRTVAAWESGDSIPRKAMQVKIALLFGLPENYFLDGAAPEEPEEPEEDNASDIATVELIAKLFNEVREASSQGNTDSDKVQQLTDMMKAYIKSDNDSCIIEK